MKFIWCMLLISLSLVRAGFTTMPKDMSFGWKFGDNNDIHFKFYVSPLVMDQFCWAAIGFQDPNLYGMDHADIALAIFDQKVRDNWSETTDTPLADEKFEEGTDHVYPTADFYQAKDFTVYTWTRPLDTGDPFDNVMVKDKDYNLLWACGYCDNSEAHMSLVKHKYDDRGKVFITLSPDFMADTPTIIDAESGERAEVDNAKIEEYQSIANGLADKGDVVALEEEQEIAAKKAAEAAAIEAYEEALANSQNQQETTDSSDTSGGNTQSSAMVNSDTVDSTLVFAQVNSFLSFR